VPVSSYVLSRLTTGRLIGLAEIFCGYDLVMPCRGYSFSAGSIVPLELSAAPEG
jgi:hypothetical protein